MRTGSVGGHSPFLIGVGGDGTVSRVLLDGRVVDEVKFGPVRALTRDIDARILAATSDFQSTSRMIPGVTALSP